jgi:phytoene dehydrogenase-like protein
VTTSNPVDAIVIGSGPNGLSAAIALAQAGKSVRIYEAQPTIGGGLRSAELTRPGFVHDVCATVHALALSSPFLKSLPLAAHGFELVHPPAPLAHPLDDGSAVIVRRSIAETADSLSGRDGRAYTRLLTPFVERHDELMDALLAPFSTRRALLMARFGVKAIRSAHGLASASFADERARAMFAGVAAHSMVPLDKLATAGYGLGLLITAHAVGWPFARGGSQTLANAMVSYFLSLGGEIVSGSPVESLSELPRAKVVLCDITPRQFLRIGGNRVPTRYGRRLARYRYGPGVFKMDWALRSPVPWRAAACNDAGTLHLGGTETEIAHGERESWEGRHTERPYVLTVQASRFDATRTPEGKHSLWAYCHVPNASTVDMRERIENQIERFAPGFKDCIETRSSLFPADMEARDANYIGGDIAGGATDVAQIFARPVLSLHPYRTAVRGVYLCSSATPPGAGVHGMCGYWAAHDALATLI